MEAKRIEISAELWADHKKTDIVKQLRVSIMTVRRVADRMMKSEALKDRPRYGGGIVANPKRHKKGLRKPSDS